MPVRTVDLKYGEHPDRGAECVSKLGALIQFTLSVARRRVVVLMCSPGLFAERGSNLTQAIKSACLNGGITATIRHPKATRITVRARGLLAFSVNFRIPVVVPE